MIKKCVGCGIELQNSDSTKNGYLPKLDFEDKKKDILCQRCFKIKNYGQHILASMTEKDYRDEVSKSMEEADVVLPVFDIIDFEGSFDNEILDVLREKDSIIVINKLDLIPDDKHPSEVADWVKNRLAEEGIVPLDIAIVSSKNGYGINGIFKKIKYFYPNRVNVLVLGVTNVGKSSIVNRLIGAKRVTVSKFPGTTLKSIKTEIPFSKITLMDTPGLIPKGRFSDYVCEICNQKIIPSSEISRKTYKVQKNRVILIGGMVEIRVLNEDGLRPIFSLYASKNVDFHETNIKKAIELNKLDNFLTPPCKECKSVFESLPKIKKIYKVKTDEELVFKGLGWISVKRGPLNIEITTIEQGDIIIRNSFIKPRR